MPEKRWSFSGCGEPVKNGGRGDEGHKLTSLKETDGFYMLPWRRANSERQYSPNSCLILAPAEILRIGIAAASGPVKLAWSFSVADVVIIDTARERTLFIVIFFFTAAA